MGVFDKDALFNAFSVITFRRFRYEKSSGDDRWSRIKGDSKLNGFFVISFGEITKEDYPGNYEGNYGEFLSGIADELEVIFGGNITSELSDALEVLRGKSIY